jgi:DMSO/TMAO reductase YedYZ molybdopterin-dependent catalytic subunit
MAAFVAQVATLTAPAATVEDGGQRGCPMQRAEMNPAGFLRRIPLLPHQMQARVTATADMIVLCHLGVPRLDAAEWSLAIDGLVERPLRLRFSDLTAYPRHAVTSVHQCAGSPLAPFEPTQRVCNVRWGGTRLADVLRDVIPMRAAKFVWSRGADHGAFGGMEHAAYVKDLPIERVPAEVLIAYELNGAPLPAEHGFPARLLVPGFYGTNSVKWLTRITLADRRSESAFTTRWYNDPAPASEGRDGAQTIPVWSVAPQSVIVAPAPGDTCRRDKPLEIRGWAWSDGGIERVEVSANGGARWTAAEVEARVERSWQRFIMSWRPDASGPVTLCARATSRNGAMQPMNRARNAIHCVDIRIE